MKKENKTREQLVEEIKTLKSRLAKMSTLESEHKRTGEIYNVFFENTGTAIALIDEDTTVFMVNSEFEKITGYLKIELEGKKSWTEFVVPEDVERMKEYHQLRRINPEDAPHSYDFRFLDKSGGIRNVFATISMVPGTRRSMASIVDISERHQVAKALQESERRFKELWDDAPIAYHTLDTQGIITGVNQTELRMLGFNLDEMLGRHIFDFILPEQREKARERFHYKLSGKYLAKSENRIYIKKDGSEVYVSIDDILERNKNGEVVGIRTTMVDMTERKRAEDDLVEQKEFSVKLIQNSTTPTFVLDAQHNVIMWNKACEKLTGIKESSIVGTDSQWKAFYENKRPMLSDIIVDGKCDEVFKHYSAYKKSDILSEGLHCEEWIKNLGGRERYLVFDSAPVCNSKGELIAAIETFRDITEHKRAEEELEKSFKKLQFTLEETVNALASTAEKRDSYTASHQHRVTQLACAMAREMGLSDDRIEGVRVAATLHDIGKIYVPAEILNKPGRLLDLEMGLIKIHPKIGYDILKSIPFSWPVAQIVLQHHERIDGSGYPLGLSGDDIFLEARILSVADVVEAISFHRPYRPNLGMEKALEEIAKFRGVLYDARAVDACIDLISNKNFTFH